MASMKKEMKCDAPVLSWLCMEDEAVQAVFDQLPEDEAG